MKLEAEGQRAIVDPQSDEIHTAVSRLALPDRTFLILSRSGTSCVQVMIVGENRLARECREGGAEQQLRSARDDFSTGEVVEILEAHRRGEDSWRNENEWRPIDVSPRKERWDKVNFVLTIAGLVLMLDAVIAFSRSGGDPILGLQATEAFAIACVAVMASAIIDLRGFRTMDAMDRVRVFGAIGVVGEPIGERPNSYSENDVLTLPNSRVVFVPAVLPDVRIDPQWPDWRAGRDPALDWILSQP